jgi:hypothetical protein
MTADQEHNPIPGFDPSTELVFREPVSSVEVTQKDGGYIWKIKVYEKDQEKILLILEDMDKKLREKYGQKPITGKNLKEPLLEISSMLSGIRKTISLKSFGEPRHFEEIEDRIEKGLAVVGKLFELVTGKVIEVTK